VIQDHDEMITQLGKVAHDAYWLQRHPDNLEAPRPKWEDCPEKFRVTFSCVATAVFEAAYSGGVRWCPHCSHDLTDLGAGIQANKPYSRVGDMSRSAYVSLIQQVDGDMVLVVRGEDGSEAEVEFCTSGGRSQNTRKALVALAEAIDRDNQAT
jgi:hypothetical protein